MNYENEELNFGKVTSVDGAKIEVEATALLKTLSSGLKVAVEIGAFVNCGGFHGDTICIISRIQIEKDKNDVRKNIVLLDIIGSLDSSKRFSRGVARLPTIDCNSYLLEGAMIQAMLSIPEKDEEGEYLEIGSRPMEGSGNVFINVDKFFARHVAILGTSGSGKSCSVASIFQSVLKAYNHPRIVIFDLHSEYAAAFDIDKFNPFKNKKPQIIDWIDFVLPYWLLDFEEFLSIYYPDAGGTQASKLKDQIVRLKKEELSSDIDSENVSVDSPIFFDMERLIESLKDSIKGASKTDADPTQKILLRLESIFKDPKFKFLHPTNGAKWTLEYYFKWILGMLESEDANVTILDLGGLPTEVRTTCIGVLSRLLFDYCYWDLDPESLPICLVLEEAHNYIPDEDTSKYRISLQRIEKIAKEGRKYGISLVVVSQRPSNVSSTVLSQCGTFITLRLTNDADQNKISRLLPDTLGNQSSILPSLRDGEALVTGDAVKIPTRVKFPMPSPPPRSNDVRYHKAWKDGLPTDYSLSSAISHWMKQSKKP